MQSLKLRLLYYGIPTLVFALTIGLLNAAPFLKQPRGHELGVATQIDRVQHLSLSGHWEEAGLSIEGLVQDWLGVQRRIRFMAEGSEIREFDLHLAELQGAVESQDETEVRIASRRLMALWQDMGS